MNCTSEIKALCGNNVRFFTCPLRAEDYRFDRDIYDFVARNLHTSSMRPVVAGAACDENGDTTLYAVMPVRYAERIGLPIFSDIDPNIFFNE